MQDWLQSANVSHTAGWHVPHKASLDAFLLSKCFRITMLTTMKITVAESFRIH
jgi:hypothetical protein